MSLQEAVNLTDQFGKYLDGMSRLRDCARALAASGSVLAENQTAVNGLRAELVDLEAQVVSERDLLATAQKAAGDATMAAGAVLEQANVTAGVMLDVARARVAEYELVVAASQVAQAQAENARDAARAEEAAIVQRIEDAKAAARVLFGQ